MTRQPTRRLNAERLEDRVTPAAVPVITETITDQADGAQDVFAVDIDRDGDTDAVAVARNAGAVYWYDNDGSGNFTARTIDDTRNGPNAVFAADLDEDGDPDVIVADSGNGDIYWYENDGSGTFGVGSRNFVVNGASGVLLSVSAVDLDLDGDRDIVYGNLSPDPQTPDVVGIYENLGSGSFSATARASSFAGVSAVVAKDVTGDGFPTSWPAATPGRSRSSRTRVRG